MIVGDSCLIEFCFPVCYRTIYFNCSVNRKATKDGSKKYSFYIAVLNGYKPRGLDGKYPRKIYAVGRERFFKDLKFWCRKFNVSLSIDEALK